MAWALFLLVLACLIYGPFLHKRWEDSSSRGRTLHFVAGVCQENAAVVWKYLAYLGFRRELGKMLWPEGRARVLTAEAGAWRPPRVDVYYWLTYPIWERRRWSEGSPGEYTFRYSVIAMALAIISLLSLAC